jgi:hypothetical protein
VVRVSRRRCPEHPSPGYLVLILDAHCAAHHHLSASEASKLGLSEALGLSCFIGEDGNLNILERVCVVYWYSIQ